jgi:exosortase
MVIADSNVRPRVPFRDELRQSMARIDSKPLFFGLLVAWLALFHFFGNSTFGYFNTSSLLSWMYECYTIPGSEDGHGILIPFVVLALLWWKREEILALPQRGWWPGVWLLAAAALLHVFGFLIQQPRISIVALFAGIYALVGLVWGRAWMVTIFFPFVLFAFCMPVGSVTDGVTLPLRMLATRITMFLSHGVLGLNVQQQGTQLFDPNGGYAYDVAAACSGIRSLISLLALTSIFGMVTFRTHWKRAVMIGIAIPLAVANNVFRLLTIVVSAEAFGQKAGDLVHEWFGFITYALALGVVLLLGRLLAERETDPISRLASPA